MAEWIFLDQSRILKRLGIIYGAVTGVCKGENIEYFIDQLWYVAIHENIHKINPDLKEPETSWLTCEMLHQWGEQQKLSVKETRQRLKILRHCLGKLIELEILNVYCLVSYFIPYIYVTELRGKDGIMVIITGKRLRPSERIPIGLFKLTPLAKELQIMEWRTKILSRMGALSKWNQSELVTGQFIDARTRKRFWKLVFRDNKDLVIPISISQLVEATEIHDRKKLLRDHPHLKGDPLFESFKGFLDENKALEIAVNAAEVEEIKKLKLYYDVHYKVL